MVYFIGQQANDFVVQFDSTIDLTGFSVAFKAGDVEKTVAVSSEDTVTFTFTAEETTSIGELGFGFLSLKDGDDTEYIKFRPEFRLLDENGASVITNGGNKLDLAIAQFPNIPSAPDLDKEYVKRSDFDGIEDPAQSTRSCQSSIIQMLSAVKG